MKTNEQMKQAIESAAQSLDFDFSDKMSLTFEMLEEIEKIPLIEKMKSIQTIRMNYSGGGDSGGFEDIEVTMKGDAEDFDHFFSEKEGSLIYDAFANIANRIYSNIGLDCHNNEGGKGYIGFTIGAFLDECLDNDLSDENKKMNKGLGVEDNLLRLLPITAEFSFTQNLESETNNTQDLSKSIGDFSKMLSNPCGLDGGLGKVASLNVDWSALFDVAIEGKADPYEKITKVFNFLEKMSEAIDRDINHELLNADSPINTSIKGDNYLSALLQSEEFNSIELIDLSAKSQAWNDNSTIAITLKEKDQDPVTIEINVNNSKDEPGLIEVLNVSTDDGIYESSVSLNLAIDDGQLIVNEATTNDMIYETEEGESEYDIIQEKIDIRLFLPPSAEFDFIRMMPFYGDIKTSSEFNLIRDRFNADMTDFISKNLPELIIDDATNRMIADKAESLAVEYLGLILITIESRSEILKENMGEIATKSSNYRALVDLIQSGFRPGRDVNLINNEKVNSQVLFDTIIESGSPDYLKNVYEAAIAADIAESRLKTIDKNTNQKWNKDDTSIAGSI